jgi:hypothetical protein
VGLLKNAPISEPTDPRGPANKNPAWLGSQTEEDFQNGAKRTRTADPLHAMQVLYQLSYGPSDTTLGGD